MVDPAFGGLDLHAIWHSGHALRQREDPYRFALERRAPDLPIRYIDGAVTTEPPVAQPGFPTLPSNTAPLYLPLAASAFLSWPTARWAGFAANLILMILIPLLVIRSFPYQQQFSTADKLLIFFLFIALTGTRVTAWIGQTTFLVFALMLGSLLLRERHPLWAGVLLGFALSKYSLAIAVVLFLVWEWRRRNLWILVTAAAVQVGSLLVISWISRVPPWAIVVDYVDIFKLFLSAQHGLRLGMLFPNNAFLEIAIPLLLTVCVLGLLAWLRLRRTWPATTYELAGYEAFTALVLWSLLAAYHGIYDYATAITAAPLGLLLLQAPATWGLSGKQQMAALAAMGMGFAVLIMPGTAVETFLPPDLAQSWLWLFDRLLILAILTLLVTTVWLATRPHQDVERTISSGTMQRLESTSAHTL